MIPIGLPSPTTNARGGRKWTKKVGDCVAVRPVLAYLFSMVQFEPEDMMDSYEKPEIIDLGSVQGSHAPQHPT